MSLGSMEERTEGLKKQAQELINFAYQRGVKAGHEEMQNQMHEHWERKQKELIEQGRNEAWEAAKKLVLSFDVSELPFSKICKIFDVGCYSAVFRNYTASEAIEKFRAYEEQKKQEEEKHNFEIGDEVLCQRTKKIGIVVGYNTINDKDWLCLFMEEYQVTQNVTAERFEKTGRHFDVMGILKKMQEGE